MAALRPARSYVVMVESPLRRPHGSPVRHGHTASKKSKLVATKRLIKITLLSVFLLFLASIFHGHLHWLALNDEATRQHQQSSYISSLPIFARRTSERLDRKDAFGACLMFKDDLSSLPEWLAFHYTVLPLRFLYLGVDVGNVEDPKSLLEEWKSKTDLQYILMEVQSLVEDDGLLKQNHSNVLDAHHGFVNRQRLFVKACTLQMQLWNVQWTAYVDSDEYVTYIDGDNPIYERATIATTLQNWQAQGILNSSCYTMPRLRYGASETIKCPLRNDTATLPENIYNATAMLTTQRFVQHAHPNDFHANRFGKVLMNVSALPVTMVETKTPFSIHRPYKDYCGKAADTRSSRLRANHYVGSIERFLGRQSDIRRTAEQYQKLSQFAHNHSCHDAHMHAWVTRFVNLLSFPTAQHLLWPRHELLTQDKSTMTEPTRKLN